MRSFLRIGAAALLAGTLAACSLDAWLMLCAVALTSSEAEDSASAEPRTSPITCDSFSVMVCMASSSWPVSSFESAWMRTVRSPSARLFATPTATFKGRVILRVTHTANTMAMAIADRPRINTRLWV